MLHMATADAEGAEQPAVQPEGADPARRRLQLLWDPPAPPSRGRRPRFSLDDIVAAGVAVARADGLDAVSMRGVARRLGAGAMSLYTYVPGKTELVDLMIDRVYAEMTLPDRGTPWRPALEQYAAEHYALYSRDPWILQTNLWRPPLSPAVLDAQEAGYRALVDTGLPAVQVVETVGLVDAFVQGLARAAIAEERERASTGLTTDDYWESLNSFWDDYFDMARYPSMVRIWEAGGFEVVDKGFAHSLSRLLDSVALTIAAVGGQPAG
jgi:AcrR family transcriptional regulator